MQNEPLELQCRHLLEQQKQEEIVLKTELAWLYGKRLEKYRESLQESSRELSAAKRHLATLCGILAKSNVVDGFVNDPCVNAQKNAEALIKGRDRLVEMSGQHDVDAIVLWAEDNASKVKFLNTKVEKLTAAALEATAENIKLERDVKELRLEHAAILISLAQQQEQCSADKTAAEQAHLKALDTLTQQVETLDVEARAAASEKSLLEEKVMMMSLDHNAGIEELSEKLQDCLEAKPGDNVHVQAIENLRQQVVSLGEKAREAASEKNRLEETATAMGRQYRADLESLATQLLECSKANLINNTSSNTLRDTLTEKVESLKVELEKCCVVEKKGLSQQVAECLAKFKLHQDVAAAKAREAEEITEKNRLLEQSLKTLEITLAEANAKAKGLHKQIDILKAAKLVDAHDLSSLEVAMAHAQTCRAALTACTSEKEKTVKELVKWRQSAGLAKDQSVEKPQQQFQAVIELATQELQTQIKELTTKVNTLEAQLYNE